MLELETGHSIPGVLRPVFSTGETFLIPLPRAHREDYGNTITSFQDLSSEGIQRLWCAQARAANTVLPMVKPSLRNAMIRNVGHSPAAAIIAIVKLR
jgi:hypothetical protein